MNQRNKLELKIFSDKDYFVLVRRAWYIAAMANYDRMMIIIYMLFMISTLPVQKSIASLRDLSKLNQNFIRIEIRCYEVS